MLVMLCSGVFLRSRSTKRSYFEQWRLSTFDIGKCLIKKTFLTNWLHSIDEIIINNF